jgi:2-hydroxy-3-keto-5-methylthiopentenyl-1-phosphate phosphatase
MNLKLFVDFDGTITTEDVGNAFFRRYVGAERYNGFLAEYIGERISAQECFRRGVEAMGRIDRIEAERFVGAQSIDPTFQEFVAWCRERQCEFHIVSDGLDFYINTILAANGLSGISVFSNTLELRPSPESAMCDLQVSFPHADAECTRCACCKRNILLTHAGDDDLIVYVGEGYSDRCPAQYADIVFAKDSLQTYCQEQNISYLLYDSFADVVDRLKEFEKKKRLRKRLAAEQKRREIFTREP